MTKLFYAVLVNTVVASIVNTLVWFAVTFWVYLETQSVSAPWLKQPNRRCSSA